MRHTLARCRHDEIKKTHLPFPTLPLFAAWLHWSSRTVPLYGLFSCDKHRATIKDIAQAFRGRIWAYQCVDCHRLLLKPTAGMAAWQEWARTFPLGSPPAVVARLLVVPSKQGEAAVGRDTSGTPRGLCDTCCARRKRAARGKTALPAALSPLPTTLSVAGGCVAASAPTYLALLSHLPANDAPTRVSVVPTETTVGGVACEDCAASTLAARMSGEREAAAQHAIQHEHGLSIDSSAAEPAAASEQPAADRRSSQASCPGRDNHASMPTPVTEPAETPSCLQFLDGLLAGN